jgi:hypothetical protein
MRKQFLSTAVGLVASLSGSRIALADKCDDQAESDKKDGKNFHIEYRNGQKIHVIDTVVSVQVSSTCCKQRQSTMSGKILNKTSCH